MKKLLEKFFALSDKAVINFATVAATVASASALAVADFIDFPLEFAVMLSANAWLILEAVNFKD